jgi:hypothetical protein
LLEARISSPDGSIRSQLALNDVVLSKWETGRILDFETRIDGRFVHGTFLRGWSRRREREATDLVLRGTVGDKIGKEILIPHEKVVEITIIKKHYGD